MYRLSDLLEDDFYQLPMNFRPVTIRPVWPKLTYTTNHKVTHYGRSVFVRLDQIVPEVWSQTERGRPADLDNTNHQQVVWYLDGISQMTVKHQLPTVSSVAIAEFPVNLEGEDSLYDDDVELGSDVWWIQKPSHPYIGSGQLVTISRDLHQLIQSRPKYYQLSPKHQIEIDRWVIQPLLQTKLWEGRKFDCRFFAIVYAHRNQVNYICFPYGFARICVNRYDPANDANSAITNVSIQDQIPGYQSDIHMPLVRDDINLVETMMSEMVDRLQLETDGDKLHVVILGLDILFLPDGTPRLIEVNHEPHLELVKQNNEMTCGVEVVRLVFGEMIANFLINYQKKEIDELPRNNRRSYTCTCLR